MTIYRVREAGTYYVPALEREVDLKPGNELNDEFREDAEIIKEWGPRGIVRAANQSTPKK